MDAPRPSIESVIEFARAQQLFPLGTPILGREIGDGNVNYVFRLWSETTGESLVVKQAMPYLRCVGESYPLPIERVIREADALELQARFAPGLVPKILRRFDSLGLLVMEDLSALRVMRHEMLQQIRHPHFADHISTFLSALAFFTSDFAAVGGEKKRLEGTFINPELCRIQEDLVFSDPYFDCERNVINPALRPYLEQTFWRRSEVRLLAAQYKLKYLTARESLIHSDLHTGSIFVSADRTVVFDPEFCFFGPTAFDIGKLLGNLAINYFCWSGRPSAAAARDDYRLYLRQLMIDVYTQFVAKFAQHWEQHGQDPICRVPGYQEHFLRTLLVDAVAFWAIVMIRRMHGLAHNIDVDGIGNLETRAQVQIAILEAASCLLTKSESLADIREAVSLMVGFVPSQ